MPLARKPAQDEEERAAAKGGGLRGWRQEERPGRGLGRRQVRRVQNARPYTVEEDTPHGSGADGARECDGHVGARDVHHLPQHGRNLVLRHTEHLPVDRNDLKRGGRRLVALLDEIKPRLVCNVPLFLSCHFTVVIRSAVSCSLGAGIPFSASCA